MFCKNCSKDMSANALHCPNCGEPTKSEVLAKEVKPWSMVKLGVILSLTCVFPFVGFIFGGIALIKEPTRAQGGVAIVVAILAMVGWLGVNSGGSSNLY